MSPVSGGTTEQREFSNLTIKVIDQAPGASIARLPNNPITQ
jgi:hypothetical protein